MAKYVTRSATLEDIETLLKFEQGIIKAERPFDSTLRKDSINYYDLKVLVSDKNSEVIVITYDNIIIASGYATIKKAKPYLNHEVYAYLGFMFTHSDYRGKGVNKMVIDALRIWSEAKGISEIRLTVYTKNSEAIRAYEKAGFEKHIIEMRLK